MNDSISRKAAIDALMVAVDDVGILDGDDIKAVFDNLPSAQPEIVWCENCNNWYAFPNKKFGYCRRECWDEDGQYRLKVETTYDDFCSYAGRRTDG